MYEKQYTKSYKRKKICARNGSLQSLTNTFCTSTSFEVLDLRIKNIWFIIRKKKKETVSTIKAIQNASTWFDDHNNNVHVQERKLRAVLTTLHANYSVYYITSYNIWFWMAVTHIVHVIQTHINIQNILFCVDRYGFVNVFFDVVTGVYTSTFNQETIQK